MAKNRYYYYDHEECAFVEVRTERKKVFGRVATVMAVALVLAGVFTWSLDAVVGTPQELALKAENEALQQQLTTIEQQMEHFSTQLHQLSMVDQSLYRTLLGAEPISEDVRQAGVGGSDPYEKFNRFSVTTSSLLRETAQQLDQLERQIYLQNTSYRELSRLAKERSEWLLQMPAILPADGPVVSGFGVRRHPILRVSKMHHGIDVLVPTGSSVVATGDGIVQEAGFGGSYGKYVKIYHPATGYSTLYAHLSDIPAHIRPGKRVKRGEQVGFSGSTGRSSGPHLHYEVRDAEDRTLNPITFFAPSMTPTEYKKMLEAAESSHISLD